MLNYLFNSKRGKKLIIGTILMIIGFITQYLSYPISKVIFYLSVILLGYDITKDAIVNTLEEKEPNVDLLMILAAIGAIIINYESEAAMLLFIFAASESLESYITNKSSEDIDKLLSHIPDEAKLILEDKSIKKVKTEDLKIGDIISISKGDQIPIDGYINGESLINETALTGESVPVSKNEGDEVFAGTINEGHSFTMEVGKLKKDTVFSNIINMVADAQAKPSKKEVIIERIEFYYVITVLISVPLFILALYYINNLSLRDAFYRGMVFLTVSSPCALVASATPSTLSAISNSAKNGVLFRKARSIENLQNMDLLLTDKTGTLTTGEFEVIEYECPDHILEKVVYIEQNSNHPIAKSIVNKFSDINLTNIDSNEKIEELAGSGLKMGNVIIGKKAIFNNFKDPKNYFDIDNTENTISYVSNKDEVVGYFIFSDSIRKNVSSSIEQMKKNNIDVVMVTGDNEKVASQVAQKVNIDKYIANCYPKDKLEYMDKNRDKYELIAMIGDGINDAPALANADIGISMGSGSSLAMESSDMVIVKNDISKVFYSYKLSEKLNKIIWENIIFSIIVIITLVVLNILGVLDLPTGVVFHEGSTILVILNGLRLLRYR